jgi:hypothetical protein
MDDLFSLFISLGKYTSEPVNLAESFGALQRFAAVYNIAIRNQHLDQDERMVFDLVVGKKVPVKSCDICCLTHDSESITIFGGNERDLREALLFDDTTINCFIVRLAVFLFLQGTYQVGLVATEDMFTSLDFKAFHPGYWTIFRSDMLPEFVMGVPCEPIDEGVNIYRHDRLTLLRSSSEQMGQDIVRMLKSTTRNNEVIL